MTIELGQLELLEQSYPQEPYYVQLSNLAVTSPCCLYLQIPAALPSTPGSKSPKYENGFRERLSQQDVHPALFAVPRFGLQYRQYPSELAQDKLLYIRFRRPKS